MRVRDSGPCPHQALNSSDRGTIHRSPSIRTSSAIARIALFSAMNAVFDSVPGIPQFQTGVWMSWVFITEPLTGVILGPRQGAIAVLIGVLLGHFVNYRGPAEFLFMMGAPVGAMISGHVFRGRIRVAAVYQTALLAGYFLTPVAWELPIWGMWDTYVVYVLLMWRAVRVSKRFDVWSFRGLIDRWKDRPTLRFLFSALIGLESDILFRIFLFIPCQTYSFFYGFNVETLRYIWMGGALVTPFQVAISLVAGALVARRLTSPTRIHESTRD